MTSAASKTVRLLPALAEVALIDAATAAATGGMGISWWHAEVAAGRAPAPVIRRPRCTRWRLTDVTSFWAEFAQRGEADDSTANRMVEHCRRASAKARTRSLVTPA